MARGGFPSLRRRRVDFESLWLITFADLMVQLMAFFAVIYSFSLRDQAALHTLLSAFKKEVGIASQPVAPPTLASAEQAALDKLLSDLKAQSGPDVGAMLRVVTFRGGILFSESSDTLDTVFQRLIHRIAQLSVQYPGFYLVCEGHAAPGERDKQGGDALALSGQRAQAVVRALVSQGMPPSLVSAEAKSDAFSEGAVDTPEGRALQRRVTFRYQRPTSSATLPSLQ